MRDLEVNHIRSAGTAAPPCICLKNSRARAPAPHDIGGRIPLGAEWSLHVQGVLRLRMGFASRNPYCAATPMPKPPNG